MDIVYSCINCKKKFLYKKNFIFSDIKKHKIKKFCCENCLDSNVGETYSAIKISQKKILSNLAYLLFSIFGMAIYIFIIVYLIIH